MKRIFLIASIVLILIGIFTARFGDSLSTVTETGMVQDSILMPIGAILATLGFLALMVSILWILVSFIRGKLKKDQA